VDTQVRTPQLVFMQPQRLLVPLFQRPYVWNKESQWEPLWSDVARLAERVLRGPSERQQPHFLGAVVLQQVQNSTGHLQARTVIDGQQRLTTLQLLLDALHAELERVGATQPAQRLQALVENPPAFCVAPEDCFKVWPTNRDRRAFMAVMGAPPPVDHSALPEAGERLVEAHRFFSEQARGWLESDGPEARTERASALERAVRELLQVVVIDLAADENAQEIFETLNARGAQLTAADLIKNFVFQRLNEGHAPVEQVYEQHWKEFETGFWEQEVTTGRLKYPRSSVFLNHWLIAQTGEEIVAKDVFLRFKRYADHESGVAIHELVARVHRASVVYRRFVEDAAKAVGTLSRLALFGYRSGVMESEVVKPLVLWMLDPEQAAIPPTQRVKALDVLESWMVRRMLVRATTKSYTQFVAELITNLRQSDRQAAGDALESLLRAQQTESRHWPDDREVRDEVRDLQVYRRFSKARVRMILEALEDDMRGWRDGTEGLGGERVERGKRAIEHVMPRKWQQHWTLSEGMRPEDRERLVHTLGNLTLLTHKLNTKVSNGSWDGETGKRQALEGHDVLFLNRELLLAGTSGWTDAQIRRRTEHLLERLLRIWPVPDGHQTNVREDRPRFHGRITIADLIAAGKLTAGMSLYPKRRAFRDRLVTLLADGRLEVEGRTYDTPTGAAVGLGIRSTNGWEAFLVSIEPRRTLSDVWAEYRDEMDVETDEDGEDDDDEE
jgi:hypothetical protein